MIKLFVGLGNPVHLLRDTRHNVGYMVIDRVLDNMLYDKHEDIGGLYQIDVEPDRWVMKPQCDINLSHVEIRKAMDMLGIKNHEVCIFYDEMDYVFGVEEEGDRLPYVGTHKAMMAIQKNIGSTDKYKIGIGKCHEELSKFDFVLGDFYFEERRYIDVAIKGIAKEIERGIRQK